MANYLSTRCPGCGERRPAHSIQAKAWIRVTREGTDSEAPGCGIPEYEPMSPAVCGACGHPGTVWEFEIVGGARV